MIRILLLGSQHGNELLGEELYMYIQRRHPELLPHILYKLANPRAYKNGVRYIESDMNRSFNGQQNTYEERRAGSLLSFIKKEGFSLVLDLHTTTCAQPPCIIIPKLTAHSRPFIAASHITHVVEMEHSIVTTSLIGVCPQAISIEVNKRCSNKTLESLCSDIARYIQQLKLKQKRTLYKVNGLIEKNSLSEEDIAMLKNFTRSKQGFYPILIGENSYKQHTHYLGFKADSVTTIKV